jgi:hypothetical protein
LERFRALTKHNIVQASPEVRVFLFLDLVLFQFKLPQLEYNDIHRIGVRWRCRVNQLEVTDSLREFGGVLGIGQADLVDDLLSGIDVLIWALFPS